MCWGGLRRTWGRIHADDPGLLRNRGEASGRCGPASTLTGTPGLLQDLQGGFRKLWCRVHSGRSSRAAQDIS